MVTPHLHASKPVSSTTHHSSSGYAVSQRKRKRVEEIFGWVKTVGGLRKSPSRVSCVDWVFTFALAAYNLVRMRNCVDQHDSSSKPRPVNSLRRVRVTEARTHVPTFTASRNSNCQRNSLQSQFCRGRTQLPSAPARSVRAELLHTALTSDIWRRSAGWDEDVGFWHWDSGRPTAERSTSFGDADSARKHGAAPESSGPESCSDYPCCRHCIVVEVALYY